MRKVFVSLLTAALVMGIGSSVQAEMRDGSFYLTPQIGGYVFEGNQNLDHSPTYGLGLGYTMDDRWAGELTFNYIDSEFESGGGSVDGYLLRLDGLYHFTPDKPLVPYLAAGIGGIRLDPNVGSSDSSFLINAGGGLKYFLTDSIALRGDARYVLTFDETQSNLVYTLGVDIFFGKKKKVVAAAAPVDSDGDGVFDDQDKCPDTPSGVQVDRNGCPLDDDGDGVYNELDKCPDTPSDLKVDADGCPRLREEQVSIRLDIQFEFDKADIRPQFYSQLKEVAEFLITYGKTTAIIEGHTDNVGEPDYNKELSQRRAESVRNYLISEFSIDADRLAAKGYGEERPIASNNTDEGRERNRRVVAVISAAKRTYEKK